MYRELATVSDDKRPQFGLIKYRFPVPHKCKEPGWWYRVWHGIKFGCLWRCCGCGEVYRWLQGRYYSGGIHNSSSDDAWVCVDKKYWTEHGGRE